MGYVDGVVVHDRDEAMRMLAPDARANASRSLVDTMAAIHSRRPGGGRAVGPRSPRGLRRASAEAVVREVEPAEDRELPLVDQVHDTLAGMVPPQGPATIVHGDYRLDNTIVSPAGDVQAVLDWEICTLGDPLADIGLLQVYWTGPDDAQSAWARPVTTAPGFWNRAQTAERYAEVSGRDVSQPRLLRRLRLLEAGLRARRACTPATSAARSGTAIPPSWRRSRRRSTAARGWPPRRWSG